MNLQQVFGKVAVHLLTQRKKSMAKHAKYCLYRGPGGLCCAIGCLIPDDQYDPSIDQVDEFSGIDVNGLIKSFREVTKGTGITRENYSVLDQLQQLHDHHPVKIWAKNLGGIADRHLLSVAGVCEALPADAAEIREGQKSCKFGFRD